jgi:hypothetical protein
MSLIICHLEKTIAVVEEMFENSEVCLFNESDYFTLFYGNDGNGGSPYSTMGLPPFLYWSVSAF